MQQAPVLGANNLNKVPVGLISILDYQIRELSLGRKKYRINKMNKGTQFFVRQQSQKNFTSTNYSKNTNFFGKTISPKKGTFPFIKQLNINGIKSNQSVLSIKKEKNLFENKCKKLFQLERSNSIMAKTGFTTINQVKNKEKFGAGLKLEGSKPKINNLNEENKGNTCSSTKESKGYSHDYSFHTIKNKILSFSQTLYCSYENVIDISDYSVFGLFDGYGPEGKDISRNFKYFFKKFVLNKSNYIDNTNTELETNQQVFDRITKDDYYFIRRLFEEYCKILVDLPSYAKSKQSGVSLFIAFIFKEKAVYLSVGDIKAYLLSNKIISEREHLIVNAIDPNCKVDDLWEKQIVNLLINYIDINTNNRAILVGTNSILNKYSTVNLFAKHINISIKRESANSIVKDLIQLFHKTTSYQNGTIEDSGLGLIIFNH